jgi:hypothetical protein
MKTLVLGLVLAVAACKKPDAVSGPVPAATSGSAAPAAGSDASFDDSLTIPTQPARSPREQAAIDDAIRALRAALHGAKSATDAAVLCKVFPPLGEAMTHLMQVTAPSNVDAMMFSRVRDAILQRFDGTESWCRDPETVGVDTLQDVLSAVRTQFLDFIHLGA